MVWISPPPLPHKPHHQKIFVIIPLDTKILRISWIHASWCGWINKQKASRCTLTPLVHCVWWTGSQKIVIIAVATKALQIFWMITW